MTQAQTIRTNQEKHVLCHFIAELIPMRPALAQKATHFRLRLPTFLPQYFRGCFILFYVFFGNGGPFWQEFCLRDKWWCLDHVLASMAVWRTEAVHLRFGALIST